MSTPSPEVVGLMLRLSDALGQATQPSSLTGELQRAVSSVRLLFTAAACSCALVEADEGSLRFVAADGAGAAEILGVSLPVGTGIAGWAVMSGQPIVVADVRDDPRFARDVAASTNYVPETILAAPLTDEAGTVLGVIEVLDPTARGEHSGRDLDLLGVVASFTASVVRLARVYDTLGGVLVRALAGATNEEDFGAALAELGSPTSGGTDLAALARSFHDLASIGPEEAALAQRVLADVARFTTRRR